MKNLALCLSAMLLSFHLACFAAPITCVPVKNKAQQHNNIMLGEEMTEPATQVYFLKNVSKKSLWLDRYTQHFSTTTGWASYLRPGQWSALLLTKKDFLLSCAVIQPGKVTYENCAQAISVCVPNGLALNTKRKGGYWLVEDKTWEELLRVLERKSVK